MLSNVSLSKNRSLIIYMSIYITHNFFYPLYYSDFFCHNYLFVQCKNTLFYSNPTRNLFDAKKNSSLPKTFSIIGFSFSFSVSNNNKLFYLSLKRFYLSLKIISIVFIKICLLFSCTPTQFWGPSFFFILLAKPNTSFHIFSGPLSLLLCFFLS